jgi:ketosteroid isomerase-like protein
MAESLLERIRAGYGAWNEDDLDRTLAFLSPDIEWHTSASFPGTRPLYRGHDGFREFWGHLHEPWEGIHIEIESYTREGEVAILHIRFHGTSKASGVAVDLPWFQVLVIDEAHEVILRSALDRSVGDALEALDVADAFPEF